MRTLERIENAGWYVNALDVHGVKLLTAEQRISPAEGSKLAGGELRIYIEGDGLAWISRHIPSSDPTPIKPMALLLAFKDPQTSVYLGRPCQYYLAHSDECSPSLWQEARFGRQVLTIMDAALDRIKEQYQAESLSLVGYSGGGAIAVLLAAERNDIQELITVAGNLDHEHWAQCHNVSLLKDSLNPVSVAHKTVSVRQYHFYGERDAIIPQSVVERFEEKLPIASNVTFRSVSADHHCCWPEQWEKLLLEIELMRK